MMLVFRNKMAWAYAGTAVMLGLLAAADGAAAQAPGEPPVAPASDAADSAKKLACPCESQRGEGFGAFLLGAGLFDLSALNARLRANGYEELDGVVTVIGGEGHGITDGGFVIGGRGAALMGPSGAGPDDIQVSYGGGFGMLDAGYAFVHEPGLLFMLTGGIGGYGISLDFSDERSARFDEVLRMPRRSTSLSAGGLLVGITLGVDARIRFPAAPDGGRGYFTIGARISGLFGPQLGDWGLPDGQDATAGPNGRLAGVFAALAIGFGGGDEG